MNAKDWLATSRLAATVKAPYFTSALFHLIPYPMPGLGTFAVSDKGVLLYDPALADDKKWTIDATAWAFIHEVGHYIRDHAGRQKIHDADPMLFNFAGDCEINDDIVAARGVLPVDPWLPSKIEPPMKDGLTAEEYYHAIRKMAQQQSGKGKGKGKPQDGEDKGDGQGQSGTIPAGKLGPGNGGCGSVSGNPHPAEAKLPADLGRSEVERRRVQKQVAEAVREEAKKGRGTVPAGLSRWAEIILGVPKIPWQSKLARACRAAVAFKSGAVDYSYSKPSRRQAALGFGPNRPILPALRAPVPQAAAIVDTSGSMGAGQLESVLIEINGILRAIGSDIDFVACDADVHSHRRVRHPKEIIPLMKGGGGTDMRPAFEAVLHGTKKPNIIICCTDGYIGDPGPKPEGAEVIWVIIGGGKFAAPWGEVIEVDEGPR